MAEAGEGENPECAPRSVSSPFKTVNTFIKIDNGRTNTSSLNDLTD